jgi:hypothetical protein
VATVTGTRPLGLTVLAAALAIAALGLQAWPLVAWIAATALNVLAVVAVLDAAVDVVFAERPFAGATVAAFATAAAVLCPGLAPPLLGAGEITALGCGVFVVSLLLWVERCERPTAPVE